MDDSDLIAISERLFAAWADERKLSLFSRAPLRRCGYAAFEAGAEVGRCGTHEAEAKAEGAGSVDALAAPLLHHAPSYLESHTGEEVSTFAPLEWTGREDSVFQPNRIARRHNHGLTGTIEVPSNRRDDRIGLPPGTSERTIFRVRVSVFHNRSPLQTGTRLMLISPTAPRYRHLESELLGLASRKRCTCRRDSVSHKVGDTWAAHQYRERLGHFPPRPWNDLPRCRRWSHADA